MNVENNKLTILSEFFIQFSPPTKILAFDKPLLTQSNFENNYYCNSSNSGGYSFGENLNGSSTGFSQGGGGHSNFFATAKAWK